MNLVEAQNLEAGDPLVWAEDTFKINYGEDITFYGYIFIQDPVPSNTKADEQGREVDRDGFPMIIFMYTIDNQGRTHQFSSQWFNLPKQQNLAETPR